MNSQRQSVSQSFRESDVGSLRQLALWELLARKHFPTARNKNVKSLQVCSLLADISGLKKGESFRNRGAMDLLFSIGIDGDEKDV